MDRRKFVVGTVAGASALTFSACGGGASGAPTSPLAPAPAPAPAPAALLGKYRYQSAQLFQTAAAASYPSHVVGGPTMGLDWAGPNIECVDYFNRWLWDHRGGDWLDATQTRQGASPWFSIVTNAVSGEKAVHAYTVNCTAALQFIQANDRWNAFLMRCPNAPRGLAGKFNTTNPPPVINVTYVGGATAVLACKLTAKANAPVYPETVGEYISTPAFLEFDKPTLAVQSATMFFTIIAHWSGGTPTTEFFVLDPPINTAQTVLGIANGAALDAGLVGHPGIINFPHRYIDGTTLADFTLNGPAYSSSSAFDPYIYQGASTHNYSKYPHAGLGKFINLQSGSSVVTSAYTGDGFAPLAPGLGALRVTMEHDPRVVDGFDSNGYNGTSGAATRIFMPEPIYGLLDHIFVRYYMRIGTPLGRPYRMNKAQVCQMSQAPGTGWLWADCAGKTGITAGHPTTNGEGSGGSGGGWGWTLRHSWADCRADDNGPDVEGWRMGLHTYDFGAHNPAGYNYSNETESISSFGRNGMGAFSADKWYCIETETKVNTVMAASPGFLPDGIVRVWIDGRLVLERTGMVMRSLPLRGGAGAGVVNPPYSPDYVMPVRELGISALWFNWYHGGLTRTSVPRTQFITGLAYGTEYIGPMKFGGS